MPIQTFAQRFFAGIDSFTLLCIPGFTLAGNLMNQGGISDKLMDFCDKLVGHLTGGMAYANIMASMIFAGISGTALSDTVALGGIEIPMMVDMGYDADFSVAVTAASSCMGPIIPPSIIMVIYCTLTGASVGNMFKQGMLVGVTIMVVLMAEVLFFARKEKWPKQEVKRTPAEIFKVFLDAIPALMTPIIILGGIYSGMLTATESAAVAVVWAAIAGLFIYKELTLKELIPILKDSAKSSAMILFIIASSTAFSWVFTFSGASQALVDTVVAMNLNSTLLCFVVAIILLIFGTFMEGTAIAVLLVPVLWPIAQSMGIDVIHFGMIVCISNVVGTMTPPVAVNIFSASTVSGLKMGDIAKAEIPFLIGYVAVFFLCVFSRGFCTMLI